VLKLLTGTIISLQAARQSFDVDLGIGQLHFKSGRVVEFKPAAGSSSSLAVSQPAAGGNRLDAAALSQLRGSAGE
jgi:hypothetical protein